MKQLPSFLLSTLSPFRIGFLIFFVTNRCNFNCPFCFYRKEINQGHKEDELTLEEIKHFAQKIGPIAQLSLTGGEPFLRPDFADVAAVMAKHCKPTYLSIPTNGSLTSKTVQFLESFLPQFENTNLRLVLSIDGLATEHDNIRGTNKAFERAIKTYEAITPLREKHNNLIIDANACFSASNQDSLKDSLTTLYEEYAFDNLSVTYARGDISDPSLKVVSSQKYIEINDYLESLPRKKESRFLYPIWKGVRDVSRDHLVRTIFNNEFITPCVAGRKMVVVKETGEVEPCEILDRSMGNLRDYDYDIYQIINGERGKSIRDHIKKTKCKCSHECALTSNVAWSPRVYPQLVKAAIKNIGKKSNNA